MLIEDIVIGNFKSELMFPSNSVVGGKPECECFSFFERSWCGYSPGGGGGGGALGYLGGCIRSLSKLKNTPKALISGRKSTLI